jgi:flagellar basal body-associated protein FliL
MYTHSNESNKAASLYKKFWIIILVYVILYIIGTAIVTTSIASALKRAIDAMQEEDDNLFSGIVFSPKYGWD